MSMQPAGHTTEIPSAGQTWTLFALCTCPVHLMNNKRGLQMYFETILKPILRLMVLLSALREGEKGSELRSEQSKEPN